jgi:hypothetical protein
MKLKGTEIACLLSIDTENELKCIYENPNSIVSKEDFLRK